MNNAKEQNAQNVLLSHSPLIQFQLTLHCLPLSLSCSQKKQPNKYKYEQGNTVIRFTVIWVFKKKPNIIYIKQILHSNLHNLLDNFCFCFLPPPAMLVNPYRSPV